MSKQCDIIRDLLPLYVDSACSEASADMIREHLETCPHCRELLRQMSSPAPEAMLEEERESVLVRRKRTEGIKLIRYLFAAFAILYWPVLILLSFCAETDGTFIILPPYFVLLVLLFSTLPYYLVFIEVGRQVCRGLSKRAYTAPEKVFNLIGGGLAAAIILLGIATKIWKGAELIHITNILAGLLALNWGVSAVVCKKRPHLKETLTDKIFWIMVTTLLVTASSAIVIPTMIREAQKASPDGIISVSTTVSATDTGSELDGVYFDISEQKMRPGHFSNPDPFVRVTLVNQGEGQVVYHDSCYLYRKTEEGWVLCADKEHDFPAAYHTLPAGESILLEYSIRGYAVDVTQDGEYKFSIFVDGKEIWFTFRVAVEVETAGE